MISYCKKNKKFIIIIVAFSLLFFLQRILVPAIGYDTDQYLADSGEARKQWLSCGRYMLAGIDFLIRKIGYNIYIANFITAVNMAVYAVLFVYFLNVVFETNDIYRNILTAIILISSPIFLEQYYFSLQEIEVSFSLILMMITYLQTYLWIVENKKIYILTISLILSCCIAVYQSNAVLYIIGVLIVLLKINEENTKENIRNIFRCCAVWTVGLMEYFLMKKIVLFYLGIKEGDYIEGQITWLNGSISEACVMIAKSIGRVVLGIGHVLNLGYLICIVYVIWKIVKSDSILKWKNFYLAALLISPMLLNVLLASRLLIRSVLGIPYVCSFFFWYYYKENRKLSVVFGLLILSQIINSQLLLYSDNVRYKNDIKIARKIYQDCNADEKTVIVFRGVEHPEEKCFSYKGQTLGHSFFEWSNGESDADEWRIWYFMKLHGMEFQLPNEQEYQEGNKLDLKNEYPQNGYIIEKNECYYVNLGE